ncbi:MAG: hypothetical protein M3401_12680 [Actinomycetota bacterium]|nr:hypothetical protein [Actinomycetota bacterium]
MAEGTCIRLDVALECNGDTIRGIVDDHAGEAVEFSGWLELMSAFDIVCARASGTPRDADSGLGYGR